MIQGRTRNILLAVIAVLLFANLVVTFAPPVHAVGRAQYRAVSYPIPGTLEQAATFTQQVLDQQSAQGWEYVNSNGQVMIFKK